MNDKIEKPAYSEGQEAYMEGKSIQMMPYSKLSERGISFMRGWHTARYGAMMAGKQ